MVNARNSFIDFYNLYSVVENWVIPVVPPKFLVLFDNTPENVGSVQSSEVIEW